MKKAVIITNIMPMTNRSSSITMNKFIFLIKDSFDEIDILGGNLNGIKKIGKLTEYNINLKWPQSKGMKVLLMLIFELKSFYLAVKLIRRGDVVFFWIGDKMLLPFIAAKIKKAEINYFLYGNIAIEGSHKFFKSFSEKLIYIMANHADYICVESPSVLKQWEIGEKSKLRTINLYVDGNACNSRIDRENKIVGMLCRLTEGKRVLEAIQGFVLFHKANPEWTLQIIGSGKLYDACLSQINDLDASDYITMFGWMEHDKINDFILEWSLLLFPTDTEGVPNSVIEAMVMGTPALASFVGGLCDIIIDGENGWTLNDNTPESIRKGLERALLTGKLQEVASQAQKMSVSRYCYSKALDNFQQYFPPV